MKILFFSLLFVSNIFSMDAESIIEKMDSLMRGTNSYSKISMIVDTKRAQRKMTMEGWSEGSDKSFIKILYPKKDEGITFLKIGTAMWQYVPKIEKTIKIPPSMMLQSWMGSDFTNDDMVKESSLVVDYDKNIVAEDDKTWTIGLIPKKDAPVVWGKIIMSIHKEYIMPIKVKYFDEDGLLERELFYSDFKKLANRYYAHKWEMLPKNEDKKGHKTTIIVDEIKFDHKIDSNMFSKRALKKYSR